MGRTAIDLDADDIVDAALAILREQGLDAVSMRAVSAALGVSPVPRYRRVGNKDALLGALESTRDLRRLVGESREPLVETTRLLVEVLRSAGFAPDEAVLGAGRTDPAPVSRREADALFRIHVDSVLDGIERAHEGARA